jgi:outer membrane protein assembly factor BamB
MRVRTACAALLVLTLGACSTVGSYYDRWFGSEPAQKPSPLTQFTPAVEARVAWQANVGSGDRFAFGPVVRGGSVYAANAAGEISKLELSTGKQLWRASTGIRASAGPGADGRIAIVGSSRGELVAVDDAGQVVWRTVLSGEILSAPSIFEDYVVVKTGDGRITGLSTVDARRRWVYQRALPALTVRSPAGVTAVNGGVFSGFPGGKIGALIITSGTLAWEATVSSPRGSTELERMTDIVGAPLVEGRVVCAVAYQGRAGCFDAMNGTQLWVRDFSSVAPLAADPRYVYATDDKGAVYAFDRNTGASIWKQERLSGRYVSGAAVTGNYIAVGDYQGYVHLLARSDGALAGRVATDGSAILLPPVAVRDMLLVQTRNGGLFSIALR